MASRGNELVRKAIASYSARRKEYLMLVMVAALVTVSVALGLHQRGIAATHAEQVLDCQYAGDGAHTHDESCYDADGNLVCPLQEREYHVHDDSCYEETRELSCGLEEHQHSDACYDEEGNLVCELAEHTHSDDCYQVTRELTCKKDEVTETHVHGPGCFREVQVENDSLESQEAEQGSATDQSETEGDSATPSDGTDGNSDQPMPEQTFAHEFKDQEENLVLRVDARAPEGALPEGSTMQAEWVDPAVLTKKQQKAVGKALSTKVDGQVLAQQAVNITFYDAEGNKVEPSDEVMVTLTSQILGTDDQATVVHIDDLTDKQLAEMQKAIDEGKTAEEAEPRRSAEAIDALASEELQRRGASMSEDQLAFDADKFSTYVLSVTSIHRELRCVGEDVTVTVDAPAQAGVPVGATLQVTEISAGTDEHEAYQEAAMDSMGVDDERDVALARFFDIKIMDASGQEVQPSEAVTVNIELADAPHGAEGAEVVHFDDETGEPEVVEATEDAGTATFEAEGFSVYGVVYTVDFHWEVDGRAFEFSIPGGGYVTLRQLVEVLGVAGVGAGGGEGAPAEAERRLTLADVQVSDRTREFVADVERVEFSSPGLLWVGRVEAESTVGALKEANGLDCQRSSELTDGQLAEIDAQVVEAGDWALISMLPFSSEEELTITMKTGEVFVVGVTDERVDNTSGIVSGNNYYIYTNSANANYAVKYDGSAAQITDINNPGLTDDYLWKISNAAMPGYWIIQNVGHPDTYLDLRDGNIVGTSETGILIQNRNDNNRGFDLSNWNGSAWSSLSIDGTTNPRTTFQTVSGQSGSRMRLLDEVTSSSSGPDPLQENHVTIHYVDRNGNVLTNITKKSTCNSSVIANADGTFSIPYSINGDVDLRADFDFTHVTNATLEIYDAEYTYANTHLDGVDATGTSLKHEGYLIDSHLTKRSGILWFSSDSGETNSNLQGNPPLGNLNYRTLTSFDLSQRVYRRPANNGDIMPYKYSTNKDIYVILDPLPRNTSQAMGSVDIDDVEAPELTKDMVPNDDGTYTLSLKIDAHAKSASETNRANVLFVVDTSSSMREYTKNDRSRSRITDTHDAVLDLGERLLNYNTANPDAVEVAMLTFDGSVDERLNWTKNKSDFQDAVNTYLRYYYLHKGTDWEDGMREALNKLLSSSTDDDPTFVIFFTDGEPSQYTNFRGKSENTDTNHPDPITHNSNHETVSGGYPNFYSYFLSREGSKDEMRAVVDAGAMLYGIYAYNTTDSYYTSYNGREDGAAMLHNAIKYAYNSSDSLKDKLFYEAKNTGDLTEAFDKIFNLITEKVGFTNVVVKDGIATGVTSTPVVNSVEPGGDVSGFTYIIRDKSGNVSYKVTVAPNGIQDVEDGETIEDGTPIFTLADGTKVVGQKKSVPTKKIVTNGNGEPALDANGKIQDTTVDVEVYYYKDEAKNIEYIMPIATTGANVVWDLSPLGMLRDGYSYEVDFVVWPKQDAYDLVADLNNGKLPEMEASGNWEDKDLLIDSNTGKQYRIGGFADFPYIARFERENENEPYIYSAMSNTYQSAEFYETDQKVDNGQEVSEYTEHDPITVDPPGPMPLTDTMSQVEKQWNVDRNPAVLTELLYGNKDEDTGKWIPFSIRFGIYQGNSNDEYKSVTLGWQPEWDTETDDYEWIDAPDEPNVTYGGKRHKVGTRWAQEFSIATGLMLSEGQMEEHGLNKDSYTSFEYDDVAYYILEPGHDYRLVESPKMSYEFDYSAPIYHPMLVDGVLRSVTFEKDGNGKYVGIEEMTSADVSLSSLKVENTLRGYIHLNKVVVDENNDTLANDKTKFRYHILLENASPVFDEDHIPWYGVNDLYYHDDDFNYYQAYVDDNGQLKICTESGRLNNPYDATMGTIDSETGEFSEGGTFDPNNVTGQTLKFTDDTGDHVVTIKGNRTEVAEDKKSTEADMRINQDERLSIANVPLGTHYTITETEAAGYKLSGISAENTTVTSKSEYTIEGEIVQNKDNNITYTNQLLPGALKFKKIVQVDGVAPTEDQYDHVDGTYTFTVVNAEDNTFEVTKYIQITVANGVAVSYKVADSEEGLDDAYSITGPWAILNDLAEGNYIVTETESRNRLLLTDIVRGDDNEEAVDLDKSQVTVHVTTGDTTADYGDAQAEFTNNYYNNDGPDYITLDIKKTFQGLTNTSDIPANFNVVIQYDTDSHTGRTIALKMGQVETIVVGDTNDEDKDTVTIECSSNDYILNWHITGLPSDAKNFMVKEANYDSVTGYTFTEATIDGETITTSASQWHEMTVTAPTATLEDVTGNRKTSDSGKNLVFTLEEGDILLSKLTGNMGTMVISIKSLNTLEREAIKNGTGWPSQGGFSREKIVFFSLEEHQDGYRYGGKTVTFGEDEDSKTTVSFSHSASAQEYVYTVTYGSETYLNNASLTNVYEQQEVTLNIIKVEDGYPTTKLQGAKFTIRRIKDTLGGSNIQYDGDESDPVTTGENGDAKFENLTQGYYEIRETETPNGYVCTGDNCFYIKIDSNGISLLEKDLTKNPRVWDATKTAVGNVLFTAASDTVPATAQVGNTPGVALPSSGGPGTMALYILSIMLTVLGGAGLVMRMRRKEVA